MGRQNNKIEKFDNTFSATIVSNRKNWYTLYPANDLPLYLNEKTIGKGRQKHLKGVIYVNIYFLL